MRKDLREKITEYFEYKWNMDRNLAIDGDIEKAMLEQLPDNVQDKLYFGFLFAEFICTFKLFFLIAKRQEKKSDKCHGSKYFSM